MELLIERVSSYAAQIDHLILLITVMVGFWFLLAEIVLFWFIFKFRAKDGRRSEHIDGSNPRHKRWITIPHILILGCDVVLIIFALRAWNVVKIAMPPADDTIRVQAQQWAWAFQQAGPDRQLDTADDIFTGYDLNVEVGRTYHFELQSRDVIHSFSIPVFRLKQDTIPGRVIRGWFKAEKTGSYDIQCTEICGIGHGLMGARIHIRSAEEHAAWMASAPTRVASAAPAAPAVVTLAAAVAPPAGIPLAAGTDLEAAAPLPQADGPAPASPSDPSPR